MRVAQRLGMIADRRARTRRRAAAAPAVVGEPRDTRPRSSSSMPISWTPVMPRRDRELRGGADPAARAPPASRPAPSTRRAPARYRPARRSARRSRRARSCRPAGSGVVARDAGEPRAPSSSPRSRGRRCGRAAPGDRRRPRRALARSETAGPATCSDPSRGRCSQPSAPGRRSSIAAAASCSFAAPRDRDALEIGAELVEMAVRVDQAGRDAVAVQIDHPRVRVAAPDRRRRPRDPALRVPRDARRVRMRRIHRRECRRRPASTSCAAGRLSPDSGRCCGALRTRRRKRSATSSALRPYRASARNSVRETDREIDLQSHALRDRSRNRGRGVATRSGAGTAACRRRPSS